MLDETDWKILEELQKDASISDVELGRRINLKSPGERKHTLEKNEIITGYHAEIDPAKVGLRSTAFIFVKFPDKDEGPGVRKIIEESPEIIEWHTCAGETSYILKVIAELPDDIEKIGKKLRELEFVSMTTTWFLFSSKRRPIKNPK